MKPVSYISIVSGLLVAGMVVAVESAFAGGGVALTPDYLAELSAQMETNHPALDALRARTSAAAAAAGAVKTWDDPMARLGVMAAPRAMRADDGDLIYGVEQKLPLFGKPRALRRAAEAELAIENANYDFEFQTLRLALAKAAFELALADQVVAFGEQDMEWLNTMLDAAQSKLRAGQATYGEVLELENERARRRTAIETDQWKLEHARVKINRILNRDLMSPWPRLELPAPAGPLHYNQRLIDFALRYEPRTEVMRQQIRQAEAAVEVSRRERYPEVSAEFESRNYSGTGKFRQNMAVLSFSIPWGNAGRYRQAIRRDEEQLKAAELDLKNYQLDLREELHLLIVRIDAARREALLYRDQIVPRTESALESAHAAWMAGQSTFRDILNARRMLLEGRLMHVRAVTEQYLMMSELVLCCGLGDLTALETIGAFPDELPSSEPNRKPTTPD